MKVGDVYQVELIDGHGPMRAMVIKEAIHPGGACAPVKAPPGALDSSPIARCCSAHGSGPYTCCRCGTQFKAV